MRTTLRCGSIALALVVARMATAAEGSHSDSGPLPAPPPGAAAYVSPAPGIPFEALGTQAGAMRTVFQGPGPSNSKVEIRELIVGARALVRLDPLSGPALVDPRSGTGSLKAGVLAVQLDIPNVISVPSGAPLEIDNNGDDPLVLRLYIVEAR